MKRFGTCILILLLLSAAAGIATATEEEGNVALDSSVFHDPVFLRWSENQDLNGDAIFCDLVDQLPAAYRLAPGENGFFLEQLVPWIKVGYISECNGGTRQENWVHLDAPNQTVTYRYTDGAAVLDVSAAVSRENGWSTPLSLEDWTYSSPPAQPQAQPAFGTAVFSYGESAEGPFQAEPLSNVGLWFVRAQVEETALYQGLTDTAAFTIYPAVPQYPTPAPKSAVYGDYLANVNLEDKFFWENTTTRVGVRRIRPIWPIMSRMARSTI